MNESFIPLTLTSAVETQPEGWRIAKVYWLMSGLRPLRFKTGTRPMARFVDPHLMFDVWAQVSPQKSEVRVCYYYVHKSDEWGFMIPQGLSDYEFARSTRERLIPNDRRESILQALVSPFEWGGDETPAGPLTIGEEEFLELIETARGHFLTRIPRE